MKTLCLLLTWPQKSAADTPRHQLAKRKSAELESECASAAARKRGDQHLVSADVVSSKKSKNARSAPSPSSSKAGVDAPLSRLQNRFSEKLKGAHFRYLNEFLYSNPSGDAISKYAADPSLFDAVRLGL